MFLFSLIVSGSFAFGKTVAKDIDPITLTALRFSLASLILGGVLLALGRLEGVHYQKPWRFFVLGGLFLSFFVLMFQALQSTSAITTSVIFTTMPLVAAVLDRSIFGRGSSTWVWIALTIGGLGALWVVFEGSWHSARSLALGRGEVLFFIGTASHAAYAVLLPRLRRDEPLYAMTLGVSTAAALLLIVFFAPRIFATPFSQITWHIWSVIAYLAVMATLGTFALITTAAAHLSSAKITAYTYLTPFWVVCLEAGLGLAFPSFFVLLGAIPIALALIFLFFERSAP